MMQDIFLVENFEQIEYLSDNIQPLTVEMIDVLMSSALYY